MRLLISAMLLASAAAAPAVAQDWNHGGQHEGGGQHQGGGDHHGGGGGWQGRGQGQGRPGPAPQAQPRPQGQPGGGQNWADHGDHGRPGGWQGGGAQPRPNVPANTGQVRPREGHWAGNNAPGRPGGWDRGDHHDGRPGGGDWNHGRPGNAVPGRPGGDWDHGRPGYGGVHVRSGNDWNHGRPGGGWNSGWRNDNRYDWRGWRDANRDRFHVGRYRPPSGYGWGYRRYGIGVRLAPLFFSSAYWIADPWEYRLPPAYGPYRWVRYYNDALLVDVSTGYVVDEIPDFFW